MLLYSNNLWSDHNTQIKSGQGLQNPNISILGEFLGSYKDKSEDRKNVWGFAVNEIELAFNANLDAYARADFYVGFSYSDGEAKVEVEEAYITLLKLPLSLTARLGKFRARFGKINPYHPDQLAFVEYPMVIQEFFGKDGFNADGGVGINWLLPIKSFYSELIIEGYTGAFGEREGITNPAPFTSSTLILNTRWKNVFELGNLPQLELSISYARRATKEGDDKIKENIFGADLTLTIMKSQYTNFIFSAEGLMRYTTHTQDIYQKQYGGYAYLQLKFLKSYLLGTGMGYTEIIGEDEYKINYTGWFTYLQSEFVKYRFQYEHLMNKSSLLNENRIFFQVTFILGYHTHSYN